MKKKTVYYAHFMGVYGTLEEKENVVTLERLGLTVVNPNNPSVAEEFSKARKRHSKYLPAFMEVFGKMVEECDIFAFQPMENGKLSSGVFLELEHAIKLDKPIIELPNYGKSLSKRKMSVEETLKALGR